MDMQPVISSSISAVGYDETQAELTVQFARGQRVYTYYDVPATVHRELVTADSVGRYFVTHIRNQYAY